MNGLIESNLNNGTNKTTKKQFLNALKKLAEAMNNAGDMNKEDKEKIDINDALKIQQKDKTPHPYLVSDCSSYLKHLLKIYLMS